MSLEQIEQALVAYRGFPKLIGIIGGEPQMYSKFRELCKMMQRHYNKNKYMLFTSINPKSHKYAGSINQTFGHCAYHPHAKDAEEIWKHQPITLSICDLVPDLNLRSALIDDCWVQRKWCPTITDDGAFFCEVGAAIAKLQGLRGWELRDDDKVWWQKTPNEFFEQLDLCQLCGMPIPMERQLMKERKQKISPSFLKLLEDNDLPIGDYELFEDTISIQEMKEALPNWTPGVYKPSQRHEVFQYSTIDWSQYE